MKLSDISPTVSPSQINTFLSCPAFWAATRMTGAYLPAGPAATRGIAIEAGIALGLSDPARPIDALVDHAHAVFDARHPPAALNLGGTPETIQRNVIEPAIALALPVLRHYGEPAKPAAGDQFEVTAPLPEHYGVRLRGFTDFVFPNSGVIVDLKTTSRVPTQITAAHARQMAVYAKACPGYAVDVCYVSGASARVFRMTPEQVERGWRHCVAAIDRMQRMLAVCDSLGQLVSLLIPNTDSVVWQSDAARELLVQVFPEFA